MRVVLTDLNERTPSEFASQIAASRDLSRPKPAED
jgi:hypothetical protein